MKLIYTILFILIGKLCYSQDNLLFTPFKWNSNDITFSSVQMTIKNTKTNQKIFDGYKDASITIKSTDGQPYDIFLNLNAYVQLDGNIEISNTKRDNADFSVEYGLSSQNNQTAAIVLYYDGQGKLYRIIATADTDTQPKRELSFILTGIIEKDNTTNYSTN